MESCYYLLFSVALIFITSDLFFSASAAPWNNNDGMKFIVPRRMAKLLKKITKQSLAQDSMYGDMDIQTTIKMMHLNGLRNRDEPQSPDSETMTKESNSGLVRRLQKRSVTTNNAPPTCHSGKVYVNLTKYKDIIAPKGFHTHYCGPTFLLPVGNDTIVQILSQAIVDAFKSVKKYSNKALANPGCCAPKKVHDLYVLYIDGQSFSTIKSIPGIVASRCACKSYD